MSNLYRTRRFFTVSRSWEREHYRISNNNYTGRLFISNYRPFVIDVGRPTPAYCVQLTGSAFPLESLPGRNCVHLYAFNLRNDRSCCSGPCSRARDT